MPHFPRRDPNLRPVARPVAVPAPSPRNGPARSDELKLCGLAAVRARWQRDPASIKRLYFDYATGRKIGVMCKTLSAARKIYRCVEPAELEKVAGTVHHGGIVAVVEESLLRTPTQHDVQTWATQGTPLLLIDRIGNAHNLGALARTAAFFGVPHLVLRSDPTAARPNDAAFRVAEGGFEALAVWLVHDLPAFLRELDEAGYEVIGAATRGAPMLGKNPKSEIRNPKQCDRSLKLETRNPEPETRNAKPVALVLGNEEQGLAPEVTAACSRLVTIPGSGQVESLNVSVAGAVLMWEYFGRR
ncbi:MAG TPA: RNA methyltransferase [Opitutaceae bacterium]|nr:RNA methyltransferase [Opitutaceae bacterium]